MYQSRRDIYINRLAEETAKRLKEEKEIKERESLDLNLTKFNEITILPDNSYLKNEKIFGDDFLYLESRIFNSYELNSMNVIKIIHEKANNMGQLLVSNIKLRINNGRSGKILLKFGNKTYSQFEIYNDEELDLPNSLINGLLCVPEHNVDSIITFESTSSISATCDFYCSSKKYISFENQFNVWEDVNVIDNLIKLKDVNFDVIILPFICKSVKLYFYKYYFNNISRKYYSIKEDQLKFIDNKTYIKLDNIINYKNNELIHIIVDNNKKNYTISINSYKKITYQNGLYIF